MRKIDYITKDAGALADFLDLVQSDGLQAKGCSLDLLLPPNESGSWEMWLQETVIDGIEVAEEVSAMRRTVEKAAMRSARDE